MVEGVLVFSHGRQFRRVSAPFSSTRANPIPRPSRMLLMPVMDTMKILHLPQNRAKSGLPAEFHPREERCEERLSFFCLPEPNAF
jgi:hypothetical protein